VSVTQVKTADPPTISTDRPPAHEICGRDAEAIQQEGHVSYDAHFWSKVRWDLSTTPWNIYRSSRH
jgi:hypothetical protein